MPRLRYTANYGKTLLVRINVHSPEITIGRGRDNTIWFDHQTVSRHHAKISYFRGKCTIYDRNSMNGIEVEGREVHTSASIKPGDRVRCGECELEILPDPQAELNEGLSRLRELLHEEPGNGVWEALTDALVHWPDTPELELVMDYIIGHFQEQPQWMEFVRYAPPLWQVTLKNIVSRLVDIEEDAQDKFINQRMNAFVLGPTDPRWRLITKLDFSHERIGAEGAQFLGRFPMLAELSSLDLGDNALGDEGVRLLLESPHLKHLDELHLWSNHISDTGAGMLADAEQLKPLQVLNLGTNNIGPVGADMLRRSPVLSEIPVLNLSGNALGHTHVSMSPGNRIAPHQNLPRPIRDTILSAASSWPVPDDILARCREMGLLFVVVLLKGDRALAVSGMRDGDTLGVGRGEDNHWRLRQNELDPNHAQLRSTVSSTGEPVMAFEDLGTRSGTYVRGQRADSGTLEDYEFIEIGSEWRLVAVNCAEPESG